MSTRPVVPPGGRTRLPRAAATAPSGAPQPAAHGHWAGTDPLRGLFRAVRPKQWMKNLLVLVAPAAAGVLRHQSDAVHAVEAFGLFCAVASGTYLVNDALDVAADRLHAVKQHRPLASGALGLPLATVVGGVLMAGALAGSWFLTWQLSVVMAIYAIVTISYSLGVKREPVVELVVVASGFVLRAVAGGVATHVPLSSWFLAVTSFGALFVVTGKRAAERHAMGEESALHRPVLAAYTETFLRSTLTMTGSVMVAAYCLWAFDRSGLATTAGHHVIWIQLSVVPVIVGVLYVLWLFDGGHGGAPEDLVLSNRFLQAFGILWVLCFALGLYG